MTTSNTRVGENSFLISDSQWRIVWKIVLHIYVYNNSVCADSQKGFACTHKCTGAINKKRGILREISPLSFKSGHCVCSEILRVRIEL
jgi:hypothetical protein